MTGALERIFVIHGEENESLGLADGLRALKPAAKVLVPEHGQAVEL
jgi:hypothetical protein